MIEKVCMPVEVLTLNEMTDIKYAADIVMDGNITILRVGSVYSILFNPKTEGLINSVNLLKDRHKEQLYSLICTYEQAMQVVDKDKVNKDFFLISPYICSNAIIRIPVDTTLSLPFPYNTKDGTMQFLSFEEAHPLRNAYKEELSERGCVYASVTSGNIHDAPTIEELEPAKALAAYFNVKSSFLGMNDTKTVVTDIPGDYGSHKGSFVIISFCNPDAIEIKRLANKADREITQKHLQHLFSDINTQTPIVYAL